MASLYFIVGFGEEILMGRMSLRHFGKRTKKPISTFLPLTPTLCWAVEAERLTRQKALRAALDDYDMNRISALAGALLPYAPYHKRAMRLIRVAVHALAMVRGRQGRALQIAHRLLLAGQAAGLADDSATQRMNGELLLQMIQKRQKTFVMSTGLKSAFRAATTLAARVDPATPLGATAARLVFDLGERRCRTFFALRSGVTVTDVPLLRLN
jgi:hypothetical protein